MHTGKYVLYPDRVPKERQVKSEERNLKKKNLQALCLSLPSMTPSLLDCKAKIYEEATEKGRPILCTFCMDNLSE